MSFTSQVIKNELDQCNKNIHANAHTMLDDAVEAGQTGTNTRYTIRHNNIESEETHQM